MAATRPNFLILMGEDTGRYYGCYGDAVATTPHLDRLASEGCRYDQAYSTCPVCAPARSTVVTGQYPMKIGTHQMRSRLLAPPRLFTHELRDAGYSAKVFKEQGFSAAEFADAGFSKVEIRAAGFTAGSLWKKSKWSFADLFDGGFSATEVRLPPHPPWCHVARPPSQ